MLFRVFRTFRDITANGTTLQAKINDNLIFTSSDNSIIIDLSQVPLGKQINLRSAVSGPALYGFGKVKGADGAGIAQADQLQDQLLVKSTSGTITAVASDTDDSVDLNVVNNTSIQKIEVTDGVVTSIRKRINFIANGVTINVNDDAGNDRANVIITAPDSFGIVSDGINKAVADSVGDTLTLKSLDGSIAISASDTDDSVNLGVNVFNFGKVSDGTNVAIADALEDTLLLKSTSNTISIVASDVDDSVNFNVNNDTSIQKVEVQQSGLIKGVRKTLNFIGATIADDAANNRVNVTIPSIPNNFGRVTDGTNTAVADTTQDTLLVKSTGGSISVVASDTDDSVNLNVVNDTTIQKIEVQQNGALQGTRKTLNFIGATVVDDAGNNRVNITIPSGTNNFGRVTDGTNTAIADTLQDTLLVKSTDGSILITASDTDDSIDLRVSTAGASISLVAGENITKGDPCYIDNATGKAFRAQASNVSKMPAVLIAKANVSINATGAFISVGEISGLAFVAGDVGKVLYVGSTGGLTTTKPSISSNIIQKVGVVKSTTTMIADIDDYQRIKTVDYLPLLVGNNYWSGSSGVYTRINIASYNAGEKFVFGATRVVNFIVFAYIATTDGGSGSVRLFDVTHGVQIGKILIGDITLTKYTLDITSAMPTSGIIDIELQGRKIGTGATLIVFSAFLETIISN